MRSYVRTSRNRGVSLPFWLAIPVGLICLVLWLAVVLYGLIAMLLVLGVRAGVRFGQQHVRRRS